MKIMTAREQQRARQEQTRRLAQLALLQLQKHPEGLLIKEICAKIPVKATPKQICTSLSLYTNAHIDPTHDTTDERRLTRRRWYHPHYAPPTSHPIRPPQQPAQPRTEATA